MDKEKRSNNFSGKDKFLLADVMRSEVKVIQSKRHDARSGEERKQVEECSQYLQCQINGKTGRETVVTALEGYEEGGQEGPFAIQAAADGYWWRTTA